ncbi:MAG: hypothetical protein Q8N99_08010 [Nanoarchaeota archaeon]|nr:hypothetical protein [Nanoarchaeota archaeon]
MTNRNNLQDLVEYFSLPPRPKIRRFPGNDEWDRALVSSLSLFPFTSRVKKEYLEHLRSLISYYQPRIEDTIGIALGNVEVKDYKEWPRDHVINITSRRIETSPGTELGIKIGTAINTVLHKLLCQRQVFFAYENKNIYFCFGYNTRYFLYRGVKINDQGIVHELSHALWESVNEEPVFLNQMRLNKGDWTVQKEWIEGFARYCERKYFRNIYPIKQIFVNDEENPYQRGMRKIEQTLERHGQGVLLEIPKRWKEFELESAKTS